MSSAQRRILIVEDSQEIQALLVTLFSGEGYTVDRASHGQDALDLLRAAHDLPELILLDLNMPVMDGYEFRAKQLADPRLAGIPIIVMTADGNADAKTAPLGAELVLKKPFSAVQALLDGVASVLAK